MKIFTNINLLAVSFLLGSCMFQDSHIKVEGLGATSAKSVDSTAPIDNTADVQFTSTTSNGANIAMTWTAFSDNVAVTDHRIILYTDASCSTGANDLGLTGSASNADNGIVDGISTGTYYVTVTTYDAAGNSITSACSSDSIDVDATAPTDNTANVQFTNAINNTGDNIAMTWTAFSDNVAVTDHRIILYTNGACSTGANDLGLTGSSSAVDNGIVDGIGEGTYYATVTAYDAAGNSTTSACSSDSIFIENPETKVIASDGAAKDFFGGSVAISANTALVGVFGDEDNGYQSGSAYLYQYNSNTGFWDETKITASDAAVSDRFGESVAISGNNAIIGAAFDDDNGSFSGSAYIYQYNPNTNAWDETKITAGDGAASDIFGRPVAISGNNALVGAYRDDDGGTDSGSAYLYQYNPSTNAWDETKITASDGAAGDEFGDSVAISGNNALIGAKRDDDNGPASGSAYLYQYNPSTNAWDETKITASDGAENDFFGKSVAISENSALVGAYFDDDNGSNSGSVYLYQYNPNTNAWDETKIAASDGDASDQFGISVAISGNNALVGAGREDSNAADSGSAYLYQYNSNTSTWDETKIIASDGAIADRFGESVGISGNNALIGAALDEDNGSFSGSAYLYSIAKLKQINDVKLTASDGDADDRFGDSIAISGNNAIVGAHQDDDDGTGSGSAYLYQYNPNTGLWDETKITAGDAAAGDRFGYSVAISGNNALVGAYLDDDNGSNSGSAYLYQYNPDTNAWDETKITASDGASPDNFGYSVAISGNNALVGAYLDDDNGSNSGSAYLYQYNPDTNAWDETKITAGDAAADDRFGNSVAISGNNVLVGAYQDDDNGADSGSAYLYQYNPDTNTWDETKITAGDAAASDRFGGSVAISGNNVLVGAFQDDDNGNDSGSAYLYQYNPNMNTWDETKIIASDGAFGDKFGDSVAISGNNVLVGAYQDEDNGPASGSAYLYQYNPSTNAWDESKITASDGAASDHFGNSVSISGNNALVGALYDDDDNGSRSGSAYFYSLD